MIAPSPPVLETIGYGKLYMRVAATTGADFWAQLIFPKKLFARRVCKKLAPKGFDSFSLPDGSLWIIRRDTKLPEEIK